MRLTPVIIKFVFRALTLGNPNAVYCCVNKGEAFYPVELEGQAVAIDGDIGEAINTLTGYNR